MNCPASIDRVLPSPHKEVLLATYAIGDIQGCFTALQRLLTRIQFNPTEDRLWLVGDLVNRGPDSLSVLRFIKNLGLSAITVLGNHDLHLLAVHAGVSGLHAHDTIQDILNAPDSQDLIFWLRHQRMIYYEPGFVLVHAGLLPEWSVKQAVKLAQKVESALQSEEYPKFLKPLYRSTATRWKDDLSQGDRLGFITNVLTRIRLCHTSGEIDLSFKGPPSQAPQGLHPWYQIPCPQRREDTVIFGHWSALGLLQEEKFLGLDGGCVWGNFLAAIRLEDRRLFKVSCCE